MVTRSAFVRIGIQIQSHGAAPTERHPITIQGLEAGNEGALIWADGSKAPGDAKFYLLDTKEASRIRRVVTRKSKQKSARRGALLRCRADRLNADYLRAAQAYMLISMPTGTSATSEFSKSFRASQAFGTTVRANIEPRATPDAAQARKIEARTGALDVAAEISLVDKASSLLGKALQFAGFGWPRKYRSIQRASRTVLRRLVQRSHHGTLVYVAVVGSLLVIGLLHLHPLKALAQFGHTKPSDQHAVVAPPARSGSAENSKSIIATCPPTSAGRNRGPVLARCSYGLISDEGPAAASVVGSRYRRSPAKALDSPLKPMIYAPELFLSVRTKWNNYARCASTPGFWLRPRGGRNPPLGWRSWRIFYPRARAVCRSLTGVEYCRGIVRSISLYHCRKALPLEPCETPQTTSKTFPSRSMIVRSGGLLCRC